MADFVVATGTALKKKIYITKIVLEMCCRRASQKKIQIITQVDSAPYVGTLVQEHAALS